MTTVDSNAEPHRNGAEDGDRADQQLRDETAADSQERTHQGGSLFGVSSPMRGTEAGWPVPAPDGG